MIDFSQAENICWNRTVRYGGYQEQRKGTLVVMSIGSAAEAHWLLVLGCETNRNGQFIARELVGNPSPANLTAFGERLQGLHDRYIKGTNRCECRYKIRREDHASE